MWAARLPRRSALAKADVLWLFGRIHDKTHLPELQGREPQEAATGATMEKVGPKPAIGCRSPIYYKY